MADQPNQPDYNNSLPIRCHQVYCISLNFTNWNKFIIRYFACNNVAETTSVRSLTALLYT